MRGRASSRSLDDRPLDEYEDENLWVMVEGGARGRDGQGPEHDSHQDGSFIDNKRTGERMELRVKDETFVFDVQLTNGDSEVITLDTGAGVHVWPRGLCEDVPMMLKHSPGDCGVLGNAGGGVEQRVGFGVHFESGVPSR